MTKDQAGFGLTDFGIGETLIADKCPKGGPCDAYAPYRYGQCRHFKHFSMNQKKPCSLLNGTHQKKIMYLVFSASQLDLFDN